MNRENLPKRIMVTGGGTGIGLAIVQSLRALDCDVIAVGRRLEPLLAAQKLGATICPWDICSDPDGLLDAVGPIDGLVHNAGRYQHGACGQWTEEDWYQTWRTNTMAPALLSQAFARRLSGPGAIVAIASTLAVRPAPGTAAYATSKAGLVALVKSLALELAPAGIRVNAVSPGVIPTDMTVVPRAGRTEAEQRADFAALHPLGRMGTADEVAQTVVLGLGNPWMTGVNLVIDGGLLNRE